jgi:hypothetical protein
MLCRYDVRERERLYCDRVTARKKLRAWACFARTTSGAVTLRVERFEKAVEVGRLAAGGN